MADIIEFLEARLDEEEAESLDSLEHEPYPDSWAERLGQRLRWTLRDSSMVTRYLATLVPTEVLELLV